MIKALVFDVDGVLLKSMMFGRVLERDFGITPEATAPFFHGPFEQCLLGKADLREALGPFLKEWKWPHSIDEFIRRWFAADALPNAPLLEFAKAMRECGMPCYVASTQEHERACYLESLPGFAGVFERSFFSCRFGYAKPQRAFYDRIVAETGHSPGDLLFFDDRQPNVVAARDAGWNAELYEWGMDLTEALTRHDVPHRHVWAGAPAGSMRAPTHAGAGS